MNFKMMWRMNTGIAYTLQHGALANNGQHIPLSDKYRRDRAWARVEQEQHDILLTSRQPITFRRREYVGDVENVSDIDGTYTGFMMLPGPDLILMVVRDGDNERWQVSSARRATATTQ